MNITHNVLAGFVSVALIFTVVFGSVASAQSDPDIGELQAKLATLEAQYAALKEQANVVVTTNVSGVCPYTWARNLTIGSTGDDVRQLQRFLNGDPQTQVATAGVGSPGNESSYYGPATARAVSKFQEKYASAVLAPFGLSKGTGGFYTSTRKQANSMCATGTSGTQTPSVTGGTGSYTPPIQIISGDALAVTVGRQIGDSYALAGAQRVPFTSFVMTAGNEDVRLEGIKVSRVGLSSSDAIDTVALVDANGVQIGSARSLNSRDEATLGGNLVIPRNRSVTLALVANMEYDVNSGAVIGLEVTDVVADVAVQGKFPIRGAMHAVADSVDLQAVSVELMKGEDEVEFDEDTEVVSVEIDLTSQTGHGDSNDRVSADQEDAYLRSITLEQTKSADEREIGDVMIYVDDEETDARIMVDDDRYVITFGGRGIEIEEGDDITLTIEVNTDTGTGETIKFELDKLSDVYVVGASYGYGLPVIDDTSMSYNDFEGAEIKAGDITKGKVRDFEDEVTYGDDRVIGALEVEFEGEDIDVEDLTFRIELSDFDWTSPTDNAWETADEDTVTLDNLHLRVDGKKVLYADDTVEFDEASGENPLIVNDVEFSGNFTIDVRGTRDVRFELVADLDDAWSHFDGAKINTFLVDVDEAEGVRSEEDFTATGEYFDVSADSPIEFEEVDIVGNLVSFEITDDGVERDTFVAGTEDAILATLEVDASDSIDDVELDNLYISFETASDGSDLGDLDDCRILSPQGDEVADSRGSLTGVQSGSADADKESDQARFNFDRFVVDAGTSVEIDIVCDIDDDADATHSYVVKAVVAEGDKVEFTIGRDDFEEVLKESDTSSTVTVSESGILKVSFDNPDSNNKVFPVAVGQNGADDVEVLEIEFEAEDEDIQIKDIYLTNITLPAGSVATSRESIEKIIQSFNLTFDSATKARGRDFSPSRTEVGTALTNSIEFENVNETIEVDEEMTVNLTFDFNGNDDRKGSAGQYLKAAKLAVVWEGSETEVEKITEFNIPSSDFSSAIAFRNAIRVSNPADPTTDLGTGTRKLYEFTVSALNENVDEAYFKQFAVQLDVVGVSIASLSLYDSSSASGDAILTRDANVDGDLGDPITASQKVVFELPEAEEIRKGDSVTYSIYGRSISGVAEGDSISIDLLLDDDANDRDKLGQEYTATKADSDFVWSPNALENDGTITSNADWFSGWAVHQDSDVEEWSFSK